MAALLFDRKTRNAVRLLYAWCRHCDDRIDQANDAREAERRLAQLLEQTRLALSGGRVDEESSTALQLVFSQYDIPPEYAFELLEGMRMDLERHSYQNIEELKLYCFRVAGVVGLMMTHIMGVSHEKALKHAVDLGMAMQMTNIARDFTEDREMGRIYLPQEWLREDGPVSPAAGATRSLVETAEKYYASGLRGLHYLPLTAGLAISSAAMIYREIGIEVVKRGDRAWEERVVISLPRKVYCAMKGLSRMVPIILSRLRRPWRRQKIECVWRYS